jgi:hypothetical protein
VIGGVCRVCGADAQLGVPNGPSPGAERLSQATIAFTRGSSWPMNETAAAPSEWPAIPIRLPSTIA